MVSATPRSNAVMDLDHAHEQFRAVLRADAVHQPTDVPAHGFGRDAQTPADGTVALGLHQERKHLCLPLLVGKPDFREDRRPGRVGDWFWVSFRH